MTEPRERYSDAWPDYKKWEFHTEIYAWRRVRLGISPDVTVSPCDPKGEWCDEGMIRKAAARIQANTPAPRPAESGKYDRTFEKRDAMARELGFADFGAWLNHGLVRGSKNRF